MRQYIPFGLFLCYALFFISCKQEIKETKTISENPNPKSLSESAKKPLSPHTSTMAMIGDAHIHIDYSSPGVRDRIIFGGLLAYDQVWQAGAHMATWIESNKDLTIDGKVLPAGKYGFFTIPSKNEWTIVFNSNWNQHGKDDYNKKDDVLRFKVKPTLSEEITEHLEYKINEVGNNEGAISLAWEKVSINFNFKVNQ
ncbi:DUF2911 domain-containing protein [Winogradskyella sp.]|uniref:DUF2911 domain-containing protein n=1 Tax=Winogradskyella sp. TaxID=1883156 RepID=UPI0025E39157|nr:DUF2911 domain-containing protein [Winogradskyella sp.]MBT8245315.1 DUF2911 domain-containing protein [Winogradskyella sp.]